MYMPNSDENNARFFDALCNAGSDIDLVNPRGETPLDVSIRVGNEVATRLLSAKGAKRLSSRGLDDGQAEEARRQAQMEEAARASRERYDEEDRLHQQQAEEVARQLREWESQQRG